ncbi:ABC transporter ATP-binding protein [Meridianimaribacter sp. CL38]|uniref:ABC transporter ATP-binding protein n=1 Tax=Meridianimaribacter sp. CL38 TaxID=2213021 RepID=UPI00103E4654|nr:ABC transporter ATP-binding protein [Meridianimaribacter sp. CL38]TBV25489.1 ABC transporter ATP-binding protein [Meridianimaribacter sp. CL38]
MYKEQEDKEVLVKVEGLSKKFCKDLKTSLWYGVKDLLSGIRGSQEERQLRPKEFWAVKDINFELRRGECLGLIGHNGAGKSTLLKILNGLINPDAGSVTIRGRVGALIELGAGFNPILTGRENIYNNGAVLGFSRKEIDSKLEAIIAFAELDEFIDMPVQHYSSGMKVRLGFAVAAQMEPDVLIIDEVLAVGDVGFRIKCFNKISELISKTAVIFVSHSMVQIAKISDYYMLLDKGRIYSHGEDIGVGVQAYFKKFKEKEVVAKNEGQVMIQHAKLDAHDGVVSYMEDFKLHLDFKNISENDMFALDIGFVDREMKVVAISYITDVEIKKGDSKKVLHIDNVPLTTGNYIVNISIRNNEANNKEGKVISYYRNLCDFNVVGGNVNKFCPIQLKSVIEQ